MGKYLVLFSREVGGVSRIVGKKTYNPSKNKEGISFKGRTYIVDINTPVFQKGSALTFLFDIEGDQKTVKDIPGTVDPKLIQAHFTKETARQLAAGLGSTSGNWFLALIIGLLAGVMGLFIGIVIQGAMHLIGG